MSDSTRIEEEEIRRPLTSEDVTAERIGKLRELFPEAFTEGRVDFRRLREALGDVVDEGAERYGLSWAGRGDAVRAIQSLSVGTLAPVPDESVNFDATENLIIEGDNLEVLKLLQKSYHEKVKMIYIDPPYNTGNEFIYPDNFKEGLQDYLRFSGQVSDEGIKLTTNTETEGRFHSKWLSMMYPRLFMAKNLLRPDGVIFISIDDNEVNNLRLLMNELFGEENFLASIAWEKRYTRSNNARLFYSLKDSILAYRKSDKISFLREARTEKSDSIYSNPDNDLRGLWTSSSYVNPASKEDRPNLVYSITNPFTKQDVEHPTHAWKYERKEHERHVVENRLWWGQEGTAIYPRLKNFLSEVNSGLVPVDLWDYRSTGTTDEGGLQFKELFGEAIFDNPKPTRLIQRMMQLVTSPLDGDIVLDFFAGSGTSAQAVLDFNKQDEGNRKFILIQLPEPTEKETYSTIAEITKERVRRVINKLNDADSGMLIAPPPPAGSRFQGLQAHFQ